MKENNEWAHKVAVVIPVYKAAPNANEQQALYQCLNILGKHPIVLVCPQSLDVGFYQSIAKRHQASLNVQRLSDQYFKGISGYNHMLMSTTFYRAFKTYRYILVYQLDAWVFRDELDYWCGLGYDYIGAPWFENYGTYKDGNKLWAVGNGGFSLRRIQYFLDLLEYDGPLKDASTLDLEPTMKNRIYKYLYAKGYQNRVSYFRKDPTLFEDVFYTVYLKDTRFKANVPSAVDAASFAFEKSPSYLYSLTGKLPFGCHAWEKNEYESFWKSRM